MLAPFLTDRDRVAILLSYEPYYKTVVGQRKARFKKATILRNGQSGAIFELVVKDRRLPYKEITEFLYGVDRFGRPKQLRQFEKKVVWL